MSTDKTDKNQTTIKMDSNHQAVIIALDVERDSAI